jgi:outer membrane biogenesis lipoprotein LolB
VLWWQGQQIVSNLDIISEQEQTQAILSAKNSGVQLSVCGDHRRRCVKVNPEAGKFGDNSEWMILAGK